MRPAGEPAVEVRRGALVESVHRAVIAAVDADGRRVARLGDPREATYLRSSAKPFQALALLTTGAAEQVGLTAPELAVVAGSHGGEPRHVQAVESVLRKARVGPEALRCGVHRPYHGPTAERLGDKAGALHHNCSGKHAGMLLLARHLGADPEAYIDPASPGQRLLRRLVADVASLPLGQVKVGTDGCSAPNFALPVERAALLFARLAAPERSPAHGEGLRRVRDAMMAHPGMVAGEGRFDTDFMEALPGRVVSKSGAEGFEGVGVLKQGLGLAVKVEDGSSRASPPVVVAALRQLRVLGPRHERDLEAHLGRVLRNWAGLRVGGMQASFKLRRATGKL